MPFICFEGIDGSGKTTLSSMVSIALKESGYRVVNLRQGKELLSPVANTIRNLAKDPANLSMSTWTEFLLYLAREKQVFDEKVRSLEVDENTFVIADRSMYSPLVMAKDIRGIQSPLVEQLVNELWEGNEPETVFFCDVSLDVSQTRKKLGKLIEPSNKMNSRKGLWGLTFRKLMREGYKRLSHNNPRWSYIDNNGHNTDYAFQAILTRLIDQYSISINHPIMNQKCMVQNSLLTDQTFTNLHDLRSVYLKSYHQSHSMLQGYLLSGLHHGDWNDLRTILIDENFLASLYSLKGSNSEALKAPLVSRALQSKDVQIQIAGIKALAGFEFITWEKELIQKYFDVNPSEFFQLLKGCEEDWVYQLRHNYFNSYPSDVLQSLAGLDSSQAWEIRSFAFKASKIRNKYKNDVLQSLSFINTPRSWEIRETLYDEHIWATLSSLKGLSNTDHPLALQWRDENIKRAPKLVLKTLKYIEDDASWNQRQLGAKAWVELLDSIKHSIHPKAESIRNKYWDISPQLVYESQGLSFFEKPLSANPWFQKAIQTKSQQLLLFKTILNQEDKRNRLENTNE